MRHHDLEALVVAPAFERQARKSRAFFRFALKDELLQASGDAGGRGIIQRLETESPEKIVFLHLPNDDIFLDIDTKEDYEFMLRKFPKASYE